MNLKIANPESMNSYRHLMELQVSYLHENPADPSQIVEPLSLALGHFFMALLPSASSSVILTLTGCCLTELTAAKLEMDLQKRKTKRSSSSRKGQ